MDNKPLKANNNFFKSNTKPTILQNNKRHKQKLKDKILSLVKSLSEVNDNILKSKQKKSLSDNEAIKKDLKQNIYKSKLLSNDPEKTFPELVDRYEDKGYQNKSNFNLKTNMFSLNPLIDQERAIDLHYYIKAKENNEEDTKNNDPYDDKTKCYLQSMTEQIIKIYQNNSIISPSKKKSMQSVSIDLTMHQKNTNQSKKEIKSKQRLIEDNATLINYNTKTSSTIEKIIHSPMHSLSINSNPVLFEKMRNKHSVSLTNNNKHKNNHTHKLTNSTNVSLGASINSSNMLMKPNKGIGAKKKQTKISSNKQKALGKHNWSFANYLTEPIPKTKAEVLQKNIFTKPRNEVIDCLYQFTKESDFLSYKKCLVQYANKYNKNPQFDSINTSPNNTSQSFLPHFNKQFLHLKNSIQSNEEKERSVNCYNRIGRREEIKKKMNKMEGLDNQLKKFHYTFIEKAISNEKKI